MDGQLKTGTILTSEAGEVYTVKQLLGSGGQGEVYSVEAKGVSYALKWYFPKSATKNQKDILAGSEEHLAGSVERIARTLGETEKTIKEWLAETH